MIIAGIDEAGRGPCFGPMSIAIAIIQKNSEEQLKKMGVKDSKDILPNKRNTLFDEIKPILLEYNIITISSIELNDLMVKNNLNEIEAIKIAELVNNSKTKIDILYVDSPDATKGKFEKRIRTHLTEEKQIIKIIAENKADSKYIIVGAASILAKVTRDRKIVDLGKKFGDFGSGYPSDPKTKKFLKEYVQKNKKLPPFSRIFWSTCTKAMDEINTIQKKLF
ncbi:MAG: ribonuclease HII [Candidatus ainarchaeum sp.]|nr:ribonuclease HII [Candidatus ainarchaeum sp.]